MLLDREMPAGDTVRPPAWRAAERLGRRYLTACGIVGPVGEFLLRTAFARLPRHLPDRQLTRRLLYELRRGLARRPIAAPNTAGSAPSDRARPCLRPLPRGACERRPTARLRRAPRPGLPLVAWLSLVLATAGGLATWFGVWRAADGMSAIELPLILVFGLLALWLSQSLWTAVFGVPAMLAAQRAGSARWPVADKTGPRVALLMPIYNEDAARVFAGVGAMWRDLAATTVKDRVDFWILSDSTDPGAQLAELEAFTLLRAELPSGARVFYRRRPDNRRRKMGNIEHFLDRHGDRYAYGMILDADSLVSGATVARMVAAMDENPRLGLLQAPPTLIRARTLFARMLQFAASLYGPLLAFGTAAWAGDAANYWGHNAIFRIEPFRRHCRLPDLPGRPPLGGQILSHDFIEAAFMRRAGYEVRMDAGLGGSFEEAPPDLYRFLQRDRRWCQGNLQHTALLGVGGLHPASRLHLLLGIGSYLTSPLWLAFLILAGIAGAVGAGAGASAPGTALLLTVAGMLIAPKLLGLSLALLDPQRRKAYGGGVRLLLSALIEMLFSALLAPLTMVYHTAFVCRVLAGSAVDWRPQQRAASSRAVQDSLRHFVPPTLVGIAAALALLAVDPVLALWMSPVLAGPLLALPFAVLSARAGTAPATGTPRLLTTPEETAPPLVVVLAEALSQRSPAAAAVRLLERLLRDPAALSRHLALLAGVGPLPRPGPATMGRALRRCLASGPAGLDASERRILLACPPLLERLHIELWLRDQASVYRWPTQPVFEERRALVSAA